MKSSKIQLSILFLTTLLVFGAVSNPRDKTVASTEHGDNVNAVEQALIIQYLEIVTASVDETCEALAEAHGITFGEPIAEFGNAKTANLRDGGRIGVRAPMRTTESPVVRPYILVTNIEAAVKAAENAGAQIAIPPMEIPGQGTFSIYILGGIEHGLWQL
jgi:uncharacterized protein